MNIARFRYFFAMIAMSELLSDLLHLHDAQNLQKNIKLVIPPSSSCTNSSGCLLQSRSSNASRLRCCLCDTSKFIDFCTQNRRRKWVKDIFEIFLNGRFHHSHFTEIWGRLKRVFKSYSGENPVILYGFASHWFDYSQKTNGAKKVSHWILGFYERGEKFENKKKRSSPSYFLIKLTEILGPPYIQWGWW